MKFHIAAVLLAAAGTAQAAPALNGGQLVTALDTLTVEQAVAPFNSSSTQTVPLSLAQFDPGLGTLVGITLRTQIDSFSIDLTLDSYDSSSGFSFLSANLTGGQYSVSKSLPGGGGALFANQVAPSGTIFNEFDVFTDGSATATLSATEATSRLKDDSVFNDFIGTGTVSGLSWGYFVFSNNPGDVVRLDDGSPSGLEVQALVGVNQTVGATTVYIDYSYEVAAVPEPASLAMMLAGLALVGGIGRWRRQR